MATNDKRVDLYILRSADFAIPILEHLRRLVHKACPDVEEKMKWSFPHFDYKGEMMCSMAAFKHHCAFGFWKAALMKDKKLLATAKSEVAMGHLGKITRLNDLPADAVMIRYIKEAMKLNDEGIKIEKAKPRKASLLKIPAILKEALSKNRKAANTFESFSTSQKNEYIVWITEAKTEATKLKRLATAMEWMAEGKIRNWKYVKK